ncbi:MAG TPA: SPFH domain-containing protein [archaeon]|nr:SPFH domain-containing protein [archaeon]
MIIKGLVINLSHDSPNPGHSHDPKSSSRGHVTGHGFKKTLFVVLAFALIVVLFLVLQNAELIISNILWVALGFVIIYLIANYDFIIFLKDYERAVIFQFGKVNRVGGPGWAVLFPPLEIYTYVDLRTKTIDIPKQDVVTKDGIEVQVDAAIYLKVKKDNASVINSVVEVDDYVKASEIFVVGVIRAEAGKLVLNDLISKIEELDKNMKDELEHIATKWGIEVEAAVIQDIQIPDTVLEAMHEQKAAIQKKLARIEQAQGHQAEIEAVKAAASQLNDTALSYYYIKALEKLGEGKSTKIIFPMELTNLAKAITGNAGMSKQDIEGLMKKYAPLVKSIAGEKDKKKKN